MFWTTLKHRNLENTHLTIYSNSVSTEDQLRPHTETQLSRRAGLQEPWPVFLTSGILIREAERPDPAGALSFFM